MNTPLLPIEEIAKKLSLSPSHYESIGKYGAKLNLELLDDAAFPVRGKLILVTATTPTAHGEGKTVVAIGLAQALERIGRKSIVTSREPSLGPVFGLKGGAAGGGRRALASGTKPEDQPALPWRLSRHYRGAQPAGRFGGFAYLSWQRAGSRSGAGDVAPRTRRE
jgi:formyltetrahydrofolate synthetase